MNGREHHETSRAPITALWPDFARARALIGALAVDADPATRRELYRLRDLLDWLHSSRGMALAACRATCGSEMREAIVAALRDGDASVLTRLDTTERIDAVA